MTATITDSTYDRYRQYRGTVAAVTVPGTGLTEIDTIAVRGQGMLCFAFATATQNIDDLQVYARTHPGAPYQDITPSSATWASITVPSWRFKIAVVSTTATGAYVDADLNTVATTENGYFELDVTGLESVVVKASAAGDSASVTAFWALT